MDSEAEELAWLTERNTRFVPLVNRYGLPDLALRPLTTALVVVLSAPLAYETAQGRLTATSLGTIGTAFIAAGAALFGVVLAGLAVLGAFAGGQAFQTFLRSTKRRRETYTEFYWVAALAVLSVLITVALLFVASVTSNKTALTVACAAASLAFLEALFNALWLVGSIVRLGLYGPVVEDLRDHLDR